MSVLIADPPKVGGPTHGTAYPIAANGALCVPAQTEQYLSILFRHVDWQPGQVLSLLGIGEKGTDQDGRNGKPFKERKIIAPAFIGAAHAHIRRWGEHHVAAFAVPAVLHGAAEAQGDVTLDKVAALTAILLDLDSGDIEAKAAFVIARLGPPTMIVLSGGSTPEGQAKRHLYWLLNEPCEEVEVVAATRKLLAAKVGGDQSFGRATQVVRVPGSVHAKNGVASVCRIIEARDVDYSFDELAEIVETMEPMPGVEVAAPFLPMLSVVGGMDFSPRQDTAIAALHRDIHEGGTELTRFSEFSKVAGFIISEVRAGRRTPERAYSDIKGWVLAHMQPPWPEARTVEEFEALIRTDIGNHGPFPQPPANWSDIAKGSPLPLEHFADIEASLSNAWLVRNLLPVAGLVAIYGAPGSGKSFLALDMALRIAGGTSIDGRAVQQCPVIYVAAEGQSGLRGRVVAFRKHHNIEGDLPFAMVPCAVNLLDPNADLPRLIETIKSASERFGRDPGFCVVDTLAATFGGGDENTNAMVAYVNNLAKLRDAFNMTVVAVHHRPKDHLNDTLRGHGSLTGAMDTIIRVEAGEPRGATITKQKDAEIGAPIFFGLESVPLGLDEENEPVLSAVVKYFVAPASERLSPATAITLLALEDAITNAGGAPVSEKTWRENWRARIPADTKEDTARKAFTRGRDILRKGGRAQVDAGLWAIPVAPDLAPFPTGHTSVMDFSPAAGAEY